MKDNENQTLKPKTKRSSLFVRKTPILQRLFQSNSSKAISLIALTILIAGGIYLIKTLSSSPKITAPADEFATWKTFSSGAVLFKHPSSWFNKELQSSETGFVQEIESRDKAYLLTFEGNINNSDGPDLSSYVAEGEQTNEISIGGQNALVTSSQEGSTSSVYFFSPEKNVIYTLNIEIKDEAKIEEGNEIFVQVVSSIQLLPEEEDVDTNESCGLYYQLDREIRACAVCGDGTCDLYESCTSSQITEQGATDDCGPLYCPQDCEN